MMRAVDVARETHSKRTGVFYSKTSSRPTLQCSFLLLLLGVHSSVAVCQVLVGSLFPQTRRTLSGMCARGMLKQERWRGVAAVAAAGSLAEAGF